MEPPETCPCGSGKARAACCLPELPALLGFAAERLKEGNLDQAEQGARFILLVDPEHADAPRLLGSVYRIRAGQAEAAGNLQLAEIWSRMALEQIPGNPEEIHRLGGIAWRCGLPRQGLRYFEEAARLKPDWERAASDATQARAAFEKLPEARRLAPRAPEGAGPRYLVSKAWGYGFWSDVSHLLGSMLLAEICDRTPVVHWGANSLFGDGSDTDAFTRFFAPISDVRISDLAGSNLKIHPSKWKEANLTAGEVNKMSGPESRQGVLALLGSLAPVVVSDFFLGVAHVAPWIPEDHPLHGRGVGDIYRDLAARYLKVRPELTARVDRFVAEQLGDAPFLAVHVRGTDKVKEMSDLDDALAFYQAPIERLLTADRKLYLMTDTTAVVKAFEARYGDRLIHTACTRADGQTGVHYLKGDGAALGREVLIDTLIAARADAFVGNGASNVSAIIRYLKLWPEDRFTLIQPSILEKFNTHLFG
ncbi:MAG: hypothetical protein ACE5FN_11295 [Leptospirillia bacterium]